MSGSAAARLAVFAAASAGLIALSWKSLREPRGYGLYRLAAFEAAIALPALNAPWWLDRPLAIRQIAAWLLLAGSIFLAIHGYWLLRREGKPEGRFENTSVLVERGAYRFIRHPMYCSLLLLGGGALLKHLSWAAAAVFIVLAAAVYATGRTEERKNLERFGDVYAGYMRRTKMFIPYVF
jgi:protein-S-isoprenylcysteine O-methyltransferase Ste14